MATTADVLGRYIATSATVQKSSGEGSRGGRILGHTSSGKAIYAKHVDRKQAVSHYSIDDHRDASNFHHTVSQAHRDKARTAELTMEDPALSQSTRSHFEAISNRHSRRADHHERVGDWHQKQYKKRNSVDEARNARDFAALNRRDGMVA